MIVVLNTDDDGKYTSNCRDVKNSFYGLLSSVWREMMQAGYITEVSSLRSHSELICSFHEIRAIMTH